MIIECGDFVGYGDDVGKGKKEDAQDGEVQEEYEHEHEVLQLVEEKGRVVQESVVARQKDGGWNEGHLKDIN